MTEPGDEIRAKIAIVECRESLPPKIPRSVPTSNREWVVFKRNVKIAVVRPVGEA